jgi:macrolide-specific efflux system membrane fusion protein
VVNYITVLEIGEAGDHILRPEMTTTVNIRLDAGADVLGVSNDALRRDARGNHVLLSTPDGPVRRDVRIGSRGRTHTEVIEGLEEGDVVLVDADTETR